MHLACDGLRAGWISDADADTPLPGIPALGRRFGGL
jgi:hypothetical protein